MSYALLWIEMLAIALLWTATTAALAAHLKWKGDRILAVALVLLPWPVMANWMTIRRWLPMWANPEYVLAHHAYRWYPAAWISSLVVVAAYCSIAGILLLRVMRRPQRGLARVILVCLAALLPLIAIGAVANEVGWIKYVLEIPIRWFGYFLTLLIMSTAGEVLIVFLAMRRPQAGMNWRALSWPRGRLIAALLTATAIGLMTLWNMEMEMRSRAAMLRLEAGNLMLSASSAGTTGAKDANTLYLAACMRAQREHWEILEPLRDTRTSMEIDAGKTPTDPRPRQPAGLFEYVKLDPRDPEVQAFLARNERTIMLLRQASARPPDRFAHEQLRLFYDNYRHLIGLLPLHARSELMQGRIDSAFEDANAMFRLRDFVAQPSLHMWTIALAIDAAGVDLLEELLPQTTRTEQLTGSDIGDPLIIRSILRRGFDYDEAWGLGIFSDLAAGQPVTAADREVSWDNYQYFRSEPHATFVRLFVLPDDLDLYRRFMDNCRQQAIKPYFETRGQIWEIATWGARGQRQSFLASDIARHVSGYFDLAARAEAVHATAVVAIGAMRHKLKHGHLPQKLEELLADDLDEIPVDPYDGRALRLAISNGRWRVYSVGPDRIDDGGAVRVVWAGYARTKDPKGDIVVELDDGKARSGDLQ